MFTIARAWDCPGGTLGEWCELAHARDLNELRARLEDAPWRAGKWRVAKHGRTVLTIMLDDVPVEDMPDAEFVERVLRLADRRLAA